jgi:K+-transporting ATPase c subunit
LNGSGTDPDGTIASYQWRKISGPLLFNILNPLQAITIVNSLVAGSYQFELQVTDNLGAINKDTVNVNVNALPNQAPVANAGADKNITLPVNSVTQVGSGTDPDGTIASYQWSKIAGPTTFTIVSPTQATTVINNLVQGVYQFQLQVTDNLGATGKDTVVITVTPAPNLPPVADAGTDKNITLPVNSVTQVGSGTDPDGTIASYLWSKISGPAQFTVLSPTQATTIINNLVQGVYQFQLQVTDNSGATAKDTVLITVNASSNQAPIANAGANQNITLPANSVTQVGSGTDPDGTIASYQWTKIAGPTQFTIVSPTQATTVINNLAQGVYQFQLTVTDNLGATGADIIVITVNAAANQPPVANAGTNHNLTLPANSVTQSGSGTDPDGTIVSYQWTKIAGPAQFTIVSPAQATTVINNLVQGVYQFQLTVTDNLGATGADIIVITVNPPANQAPIANAGTNQVITLPANSVTQIGSGIDPDGSIVSYQWTKIAGPAQFTIVSPTQATTTINNLVQGVYQFQLTVTDNLGATDADIMIITVNPGANQAPIANAGPNQNITLPANSVTQTGSGTDPDGTIASYQWTKIAGPAQFTIVSPAQATTVINNLAQGVYQFQLTVTDNLGATGADIMVIIVNPAPNQAPIANAGTDKNITLPVNSVTQAGTGIDPDGTIASYQWTKIAGPAQFAIVSPAQATTVINNLAQGVYQFQLTVTDNLGATDADTMIITVNPAANQPPVANAGTDKNITLPVNSVTQAGSGTDADGTIASYQWTKIAGPAQFTIVSPAQATTVINNLVQGVYQFQLTVTDNLGATATDIMVITVNPAANQPPVANAGTDKNITLPVNSVTQAGSGTDADGTVASYQWTKIAGPAQFTIVSPAQATTVIDNLVQGVYQFQLTVTDNFGATATDIMVITVNPAPVAPTTANAGADQTIDWPNTSTTVSGIGTTAASKTIISYLWTKISGPAQFSIVAPTQPVSLIDDLLPGIYLFEFKVTDNLGGVARDTVRIEAKEETISSVGVYPNPASSTLSVKIVPSSNTRIDPAANKISLRIFDFKGAVVIQEQLQTQPTILRQIDVNKLTNGIYILELNFGGKRETHQFVVRH